ncbi:hypothetical protein [Pacificispira sp.]|uniref:hypothetical protein n=1 Tax=Pacificispira sp. TaxID=2888761 RepID=UPI003B52EDB9
MRSFLMILFVLFFCHASVSLVQADELPLKGSCVKGEEQFSFTGSNMLMPGEAVRYVAVIYIPVGPHEKVDALARAFGATPVYPTADSAAPTVRYIIRGHTLQDFFDGPMRESGWTCERSANFGGSKPRE